MKLSTTWPSPVDAPPSAMYRVPAAFVARACGKMTLTLEGSVSLVAVPLCGTMTT